MSDQKVVIHKVDEPSVPIKSMPKNMPEDPVSIPKLEAGKRHKTLKTYPKGILKTAKVKIKPIVDPARPPPLKKFMKKHTIRLLTEKGVSHKKKTIKKKLSAMSDEKVKQIAETAGLLKSKHTPPSIVRQIVEGGMLAGFVSFN
jgi:hypothetical protein